MNISSYAVRNLNSSSPSIRGSSIHGTTNSVRNDDSSAKIADTTLNGPVGGTGFTCLNVRNLNFADISASCTP